MGSHQIDKDKIITNFDEVKPIADEVYATLDEKLLDGKEFSTSVFPREFIISIVSMVNGNQGTRDNLTSEIYGHIDAVVLSLSGKWRIYIKQANPKTVLKSYFHELGHIATNGLVYRNEECLGVHTAVSEASAYAFNLWASEEIAKISNLESESACFKIMEQVAASKIPQYRKQMTDSKVTAYNLLYFLHDSGLCSNSKEVYCWIRNHLQDDKLHKCLIDFVNSEFIQK